ncbi:MAG: heterodisulfide reductase [Anaerolineales bacterium]|nr:MAG: heterodisulfide reductase [Anaerolineales bacterium]
MNASDLRINNIDSSFADLVQERSGENVRRCYYCQKCTVGCPTAYVMDYKPAQVLKLIQLGQKDILLGSTAIWLCVGCETCGTRCPNEIRLAPVIDTLKYMALEEGYPVPEAAVYALHRSFLDSIKLWGRVHEATMLAEYTLRSPRAILPDWRLGMQLILKGKISFMPERIKRLGEVEALYKRAGS